MTAPLFLSDPYARTATATVTSHTSDGGIILDQTLFYATGGGQPGDAGMVRWEDQVLPIVTTIKASDGDIALVPADPGRLPPIGAQVEQELDWDQRYDFMRMHTALHLLSVAIPLPVTGGAIARGKGRIDFNMPDAPEDKAAIETALQGLVERDLPVTQDWITEDELDANPGLVKTMSVSPPRGAGRIRLIRIGQGATQIDLQPCGGTHVARTGEIGQVRLGKIEKKGRQNRRVYIHIEV
jgi:misacylated tRNA(Ala) deacylase